MEMRRYVRHSPAWWIVGSILALLTAGCIVLGLLAQRDSALPSVTADGIFGAATAAAVRTLQSRLGYSPTGAVGPVLWSYIITQGQGYGVF